MFYKVGVILQRLLFNAGNLPVHLPGNPTPQPPFWAPQHCHWRAALGPQALHVFAVCQDKQWGTQDEVGQLHGCGVGDPLPLSVPPWELSSAPETLSSGQIHQTEQDQKLQIKLD